MIDEREPLMDIAAIALEMRHFLLDLGMEPRGADECDFQFAGDRGLYFRTGTAHNEVSIIAYWNDRKTKDPIRITNSAQIFEAKTRIRQIVDRYEANDRDSCWPPDEFLDADIKERLDQIARGEG